jgi:curved DNA-binding protein
MSLDFKDYYRVLGVPRTATEEEIKRSFRKLARQYHPDVAKVKAGAEDKFKEINEAYEVLGEPAKRKKYDELGAAWNQPGGSRPPPPRGGRATGRPGGGGGEFHFGGTGFSDFFEQYFGREPGGFSGFSDGEAGEGRRHGVSRRGGDIEGDILVSLHEALRGAVRSISLRREDPETGEPKTSTFRVKIPSGISEGKRIRIPGKGDESGSGGEPGDLYLRVRFAKNPDFDVNGHDLYSEIELAPWEAVLGASVPVPSLEGPVTILIKAGTVAGQTLRLRGKGLPSSTTERGDLYVTMRIDVPPNPTPEEKVLWEQLAKGSLFNPRNG